MDGGRVRERLDIPRFWWRGAEHTRPPEAAAPPKPRRPRQSRQVPPDAVVPAVADLIAEPRAMAPAPPRPHRRSAAVIAGALILGVAAFVVVSRGGLATPAAGSLSAQVDQLMIAGGLGVDEIRLGGHRYTIDNEIFAALSLDQPTSLLRYNSDAARRRVEGLSWVKRATVTRILPDTLDVQIVERAPIAVWLNGDAATLVDAEGRELARVAPSTLPALPRISGAGAPEAVGAYVTAIAAVPELARRVKVAERVGQRRWTLALDNGSRVLLPADDEPAALARLLRLKNVSGVLVRPVLVDLRIEERTAVAPRAAGQTSQVVPPGVPPLKSASAL